jgi:hypothetical protein
VAFCLLFVVVEEAAESNRVSSSLRMSVAAFAFLWNGVREIEHSTGACSGTHGVE